MSVREYILERSTLEAKIKIKNKKAGFGMPLGMKSALIAVLIALAARMGIAAEEIYNKPVVETWDEVINETGYHHAGVDLTGDGFADVFISVRAVNRVPLFRRIASFLKEGAMVSFEDKGKVFSRRMGFYVIEPRGLLEINGRSVLQIFPGEEADFTAEAARQERLRGQNDGR